LHDKRLQIKEKLQLSSVSVSVSVFVIVKSVAEPEPELHHFSGAIAWGCYSLMNNMVTFKKTQT
jgi:hypothetical protein